MGRLGRRVGLGEVGVGVGRGLVVPEGTEAEGWRGWRPKKPVPTLGSRLDRLRAKLELPFQVSWERVA